MNDETFERVVFDGCEDLIPLYQRMRHDAAGKPKIAFFTRFTDWEGVRRKVALGPVKKAAIRQL